MAKKKKKLSKVQGKKRGGAFATSDEFNAKGSNDRRVSQGMKVIDDFEQLLEIGSPM